MIQRSKSDARFQRPPYVSGSRTSTRNTIVRAGTGADDNGLSAFLRARGHLFGIANSMLKNAAEAEDIVQDVWIRWQTTDRSVVQNAAAFLATTTRRLAINVIQSARSCRETAFRPWLQESAETSCDPEVAAERREALQRAVLMLLQKLSPAEQAAFVLREAFDYSYREIAKILRGEEANARQLVTRARRHVADGRHAAVNSAEQRFFLAAFAASRDGALSALESFFRRTCLPLSWKVERAARTRPRIVEPTSVPHPCQSLDTASERNAKVTLAV
ncbi:MAG TPA: sigma-70 family RNA polymerase sigma factor [Candidatus Acidoferrales bacterium]|nr:sigma-70 family RNA polymerase sigma factor [Candidatus Acidoferrales bacterium]